MTSTFKNSSLRSGGMNRRQALSRLGLAATAVYSAPVLLNLSTAAASSGGSNGGSGGSSNGGSNGGSHGASRGGSRGASGASRGGSRGSSPAASHGASRAGSAGASGSLGDDFSRDLDRLGGKIGSIFK